MKSFGKFSSSRAWEVGVKQDLDLIFLSKKALSESELRITGPLTQSKAPLPSYAVHTLLIKS